MRGTSMSETSSATPSGHFESSEPCFLSHVRSFAFLQHLVSVKMLGLRRTYSLTYNILEGLIWMIKLKYDTGHLCDNQKPSQRYYAFPYLSFCWHSLITVDIVNKIWYFLNMPPLSSSGNGLILKNSRRFKAVALEEEIYILFALSHP